MQKGFSLVEILIVIAIIGIIGGISTFSFNDAKTNKLLRIAGDDMVFALEEIKSDALAGKDGLNQSMFIESTTYTTYSGTTYSAGESSNRPHTLNPLFSISTTAPANTITFKRLTGDATSVSTTTISEIADPNNTIEIVVGTLGDITMVQ